MSVETIQSLLANKHHGDVFVPECKSGSTYIAENLRILDAWALKRTWLPITMIGYEIKVSRSDFLSDDKWPNYLPLCNQLNFVCPTGLIAKDELPPEVGLIWLTKNGRRLYTKKKAPHRKIDIPNKLLVYILMSRTTIDADVSQDSTEYWRHWLEKKEDRQRVGLCVSHRTSQLIADARKQERMAKREVEKYNHVIDLLTKLGINPGQSIHAIRNRLERLSGTQIEIARSVIQLLQNHATTTTQMIHRLADLHREERSS